MPIRVFKDRTRLRTINYQGTEIKIQLLTPEQDAWVQKQCTDEGKLGLPGRLDSKRYVRTFTARCIQAIPGGIENGDLVQDARDAAAAAESAAAVAASVALSGEAEQVAIANAAAEDAKKRADQLAAAAIIPFAPGKVDASAPAGTPLGMDPALLGYFDDKAQGQLYDMLNNPGENLGKYLVAEKKD